MTGMCVVRDITAVRVRVSVRGECVFTFNFKMMQNATNHNRSKCADKQQEYR